MTILLGYLYAVFTPAMWAAAVILHMAGDRAGALWCLFLAVLMSIIQHSPNK
jgi:hypothetical protein